MQPPPLRSNNLRSLRRLDRGLQCPLHQRHLRAPVGPPPGKPTLRGQPGRVQYTVRSGATDEQLVRPSAQRGAQGDGVQGLVPHLQDLRHGALRGGDCAGPGHRLLLPARDGLPPEDDHQEADGHAGWLVGVHFRGRRLHHVERARAFLLPWKQSLFVFVILITLKLSNFELK